MRHVLLLLAALCIVGLGCTSAGQDNPKEARDAGPVYEVVLQQEIKDARKEAALYLFIDGRDPDPELLQRLRKKWPQLQPGSKVPRGKADRVSIDGLQWTGGDTAELRCGTSNGIDGQVNGYRVQRKGGAWTVKSVKVEAIS